ncbi:MAG: putative protein Ymh [Parcubacteria bacterium C7867-006]|nr:MAG: putative protein Ymh [Parcubacteria bacterium C7867-006]
MKKFEYNKENLRLIAFIIASASSGTLFTKLLQDSGWNVVSTASEEYRKSGKSKEDYLFDQFNKIAEEGRIDVLEFIIDKTLSKSSVYFKKGDKDYKFPRDSFGELKKKVGKKEKSDKKKNSKLFDDRKLHGSVGFASKDLFVSEFYSQSIFEACKLLNKRVQELSKSTKDGKSLMLDVFSVNNPILKISDNQSQSDKDEQEGFMHLFAGVMHGIRNPKGHELINLIDPLRTLEYLSFISLLFRKLDELK